MENRTDFDVIVIGGSYSGLAAGMALGRALKKVLIIDAGKPCNRQTPHSYNFITHDGRPPSEISSMARQQVEKYPTVHFMEGMATRAARKEKGFEVETGSGEVFAARKLIFATGIRDILPDIRGFAECWGISVLHCPYCHGYEVRNRRTGIVGNGEDAYALCKLISNWTRELTLYSNGPCLLNDEQRGKLGEHGIRAVETEIAGLVHEGGYLRSLSLTDGSSHALEAVYIRSPFEQHCPLPKSLGCEYTEDGYIKTDPFQETSVPGVFACGDNAARMRTVANAVAMGTTAGMTASKTLILEAF